MGDKKVDWVEKLKLIGILAVVLGHMNSPLSRFIYTWHMPLFYCIAGFFIKPFFSIESVKKDFIRLMIPYFIFSSIGIILESLKRFLLKRDMLDYVEEVKGIFVWMDMESLKNTYAFVLWFLPTLLLAKLVVTLILHTCKSVFTQIIIIIICFLVSFYIDLPLAIDNSLNVVIFVFIGSLFFRNQEVCNKFLYAMPLVLVIMTIFCSLPHLDVASKSYSNVFLNLIWSFAVIGTLIFVFKRIYFSSNLMRIWSANTMILFIVHPYTNNISYIILSKLDLISYWGLNFFVSLLLLQSVLLVKKKYENKGIFKYV